MALGLKVEWSFAQAAVKRGPERVKLKNLHCESRCQEMAAEDAAGWKKAYRVLW
jgi:hypothetical protein